MRPGLVSAVLFVVVLAARATAGAGPAPVGYRLEPVWQLDPDSAEPLVGYVNDAVIDASGATYLLDAQLADIKVVDRHGAIVRILGRAGDGPGEFRVPGEIFFFPDSTLGVVSKLGGGVKRIDPATGDELASYRMDGRSTDDIVPGQVLALSTPAGTLLAATMQEWTGSRYGLRTRLALVAVADEPQVLRPEARLMVVGEYQDIAAEDENYYLLWQPWTVDSLGRIVAAPAWDSYELRWFDTRGDLLQTGHWPFTARPRRESERGRLLALWGGTDPEPINGLRLRLVDHEAVVRSIYPRPDGRVWVRTNRAGYDLDDSVFMEFDEVDADGVLVGRIRLLGPGDEGVDHVYWGSTDTMVVVHGAEDSEPWARRPGSTEPLPPFTVACYHLVREEGSRGP